MATFAMHGGTAAIDLGSGYSIRAPGLRGTVRTHGAKPAGTRGPELASAAFDQALATMDVREVTAIELEVARTQYPAGAATMRGPEGADAFEFSVPDLGPTVGQVVLSIDEAGALHWHFPVDTGLAIHTSAMRGVANRKTFRIPREIARAPATDQGTHRGLVSILGRKILKVLIYPVADAVLGPLAELAVGQWEERNRPHLLRRMLPGDSNPLQDGDWAGLAAGRALLFVHGTASTTRAAFGDLPAATLEALAARYENRIFAFDHPTLSVHPEENARWFFAQVPDGIRLDVDIVCHSRGGLVSRSLGGRSGHYGFDPARFQVQRLVLAGVPNQGTLLANPDHMVAFLDRMTTALNVFPDNFVSDVLEGLLAVVKVIGHAGLTALDGLAAMKPANPFLGSLDGSNIPGCTYFGIGGDFEPTGSGLAAAFCTAADSLVDRIFGDAPNDLVVPSDGMRRWAGGLQIPDERFLEFAPAQGVMHTRYFPQPETSVKLREWLG